MVHYLELDCSDGFGERISPNPQARQVHTCTITYTINARSLHKCMMHDGAYMYACMHILGMSMQIYVVVVTW